MFSFHIEENFSGSYFSLVNMLHSNILKTCCCCVTFKQNHLQNWTKLGMNPIDCFRCLMQSLLHSMMTKDSCSSYTRIAFMMLSLIILSLLDLSSIFSFGMKWRRFVCHVMTIWTAVVSSIFLCFLKALQNSICICQEGYHHL